MKKIFKCKNLFLVTFLAIAGFFSAGALTVNKQVENNVNIQEADAVSSEITLQGTYVSLDASRVGSCNWVYSARGAVMQIYWENATDLSTALEGYTALDQIPTTGAFPGAQSYEINAGSRQIRLEMYRDSDYTFHAVVPWFIKHFKAIFDTTGNDHHWLKYYNAGGSAWVLSSDTANRGYNVTVTVWNGNPGAGWYGTSDLYAYPAATRSSGYTYIHYGVKSGEHIYLNLQYAGGNWASGTDCHYAIYFWNPSSEGGNGWTQIFDSTHTTLSNSFMWLVPGQDSTFNNVLYEAIIPQANGQDVIWNSFRAVRYKNEATAPGWDNVDHNGTNHFINYAISGRNVVQKGSGSWEGDTQLEISFTESQRANYYGRYFNTQVVCQQNPGRIVTDNWSNAKTEYNTHLSLGVRGEIWNTTSSPSGNDIQKAMSKYDYIIHKYPAKKSDDFINRQTSTDYKKKYPTGAIRTFKPYELIVEGEDSTSVILIVVMSSISILSITALSILMVKKRKSKEQ